MSSLLTKAMIGGLAAAGIVGAIACMPAAAPVSAEAEVVGALTQGPKAAPAFSAAGTDGKTHTLDGHLKNGLTFMYFIKEACPVNHRAAPHVQKLATAYGEKANLVGVYNGSVKNAKDWVRRYKATYPLIEDPSLRVIRGYGAEYSPWLVVVGKDGKIAKVFEGAAPKELEEVNKMMAANAGMKMAKLDFTGAPTGGG
jgi:peroxiredoxin